MYVAPKTTGAVVLSHRFGWRGTVGIGSACVATVGVAFLRGTASTEPRQQSASLRKLLNLDLLSALLLRSHTRTTTLMMALVALVALAAMAFVPTLLIEHHGIGERSANLLFAAFFAVTALSQPLAGWLSDRYGHDLTIAGLAAGVLGFGGLAAGGPIHATGPATVLAGASTSATPVLQSRMLGGLRTDERGGGFGVFRTAYLAFGATGTVVVGVVADAAGWGPAFGLLGALLVIAVTAAVGLRNPT